MVPGTKLLACRGEPHGRTGGRTVRRMRARLLLLVRPVSSLPTRLRSFQQLELEASRLRSTQLELDQEQLEAVPELQATHREEPRVHAYDVQRVPTRVLLALHEEPQQSH